MTVTAFCPTLLIAWTFTGCGSGTSGTTPSDTGTDAASGLTYRLRDPMQKQTIPMP